MNSIYFTHNYLCLWAEKIKHSSLKPSPLSNSRRLSRAFVYNAIHVGYFEDDVLRGYHGDTTDTNKQIFVLCLGKKQKCKLNTFHMAHCRALPKVTGLCPKLA